MKAKLYTIITLLCLATLFQSQAQNPNSYMNYAEHSLWNDSYPIYDAAVYKGKYYAIQNFDYGIIRLIQFNASIGGNDGTIQGVKYWDLSNHLSFYSDQADVELVEFQDALYAFGYIRTADGGRQHISDKLVIDDKGNDHHSNVPLPPFMKGAGNNPGLAVTVYKGALCIFYVEEGSHEVRMGYTKTPDDANSWQVRKAIDQVVYSGNILTQDTWDVCTWYGKDKEKMTELLVFGLIADKNMWAYTFGGELTDSDHGKWTATSYINGAPDGNSFSLKMIQGNLVEQGSDKALSGDNNPIQYIYATRKAIIIPDASNNKHHSEIRAHEFFPGSNRFGTINDNVTRTNMPYGYFGAAAITLPLGDQQVNTQSAPTIYTNYFQQFIIMLRGTCDNHLNNTSHYAIIKSNQKKATSFTIPVENMLAEPELRGFCTLTAVLEGPPPVAIDNGAMYDIMANGSFDFQQSTLTMSSTNKKLISESTGSKLTMDAGLGPDLDGFTMQALGGAEITQVAETSKEISYTYGETFGNSDTIRASSGVYYYKVPKLIRYDMQFLNSSGSREIYGRPQPVGFAMKEQEIKQVAFRLDDPKIHKYIRVDNPLKLESWNARHASTPGMDIIPISSSVFYQNINTTVNKFERLSSSQTNRSESTEVVKFGVETKTPFFKMKEEYSFNWTKSTSTTISQEIELIIKAIPERYHQYYARQKPVEDYSLRLYFLNDSSHTFAREYYRDLKRRGAMLDGEKPFILAWDVTGVGFRGLLNSAVATSDEEIAPDGTRFYNDGDALVAEAPAGSHLTIYSINGRLEANQTMHDSTHRFALKAGIYIIHVVKGETSNVYKVIKQ